MITYHISLFYFILGNLLFVLKTRYLVDQPISPSTNICEYNFIYHTHIFNYSSIILSFKNTLNAPKAPKTNDTQVKSMNVKE